MVNKTESIPTQPDTGPFRIVIRALDMLLFPYLIRGNRSFLKEITHYGYQSTYCKELAKFSRD